MLLFMAAVSVIHSHTQAHGIGLCTCTCSRTLCIDNHSSARTDPWLSSLSCILVYIVVLFAEVTHTLTINKHKYVCSHKHTHSTSTTPSYQLKQILSFSPPHLILPQVEVMTATNLTGSTGLSLQQHSLFQISLVCIH